ncbi:MAG: threonine-phosphate decarboxylase CobD [Rhizobiaceae bacterium]
MLSRPERAVVDHGGSLARARTLFPDAPEPLVDLSTGISPHPYPFSTLPATAYRRLPEPAREAELRSVAARAYGAPSADCLVAAPGTQILLPLIAGLMKPGRVAICGPTYAEHAAAAALCGHAVTEIEDHADAGSADIVTMVNPNNPDGRLTTRSALLSLRAALRSRGGMLVVDEAFMDVGPVEQSVAADVEDGGLVVLRSFGKFHGLAGIRLGFVIANVAIAARLRRLLGPWAVSGPALEIGIEALNDVRWGEAARARLQSDSARLDALLSHHGIQVSGGTSLFRFVRSPDAPALFRALGTAGVIVRHFVERPNDLRIGLPGVEAEWERLAAALASWRKKAA